MTKNTSPPALPLESRGTGKGVAHALRRQGKLPAVVYGHGQPPVPVALDLKAFQTAASSHKGPVLDVSMPDGNKAKVLIREVGRDPISGRIAHLDLLRVVAGETVRSEIQVSLDDEQILVKAGLIPSWVQDHVSVEATPDLLPERLHIPSQGLAFGDQVTAKDLHLDKGVRLLTDPDLIILTVGAPKVEVPEKGTEAAEASPDAGS